MVAKEKLELQQYISILKIDIKNINE